MDALGLRELEAILAVGTHGSFRRAALALGMSPSALSHAVASAEARLGIRLFNRTTRSVRASEAGARLIARIGPLLRALDDALAETSEQRLTPAGTLRINVSTAAQRFVVPRMAAFLTAYPDMRLDLVAEDRLVGIVEEGFDAGIRLAEAVPLDMVAVRCSPDLDFAVVASPAYLERAGKPHVPAELRHHACIRRRLSGGRLYAWEFERSGEEIAVEVAGVLTADHEGAMIAAARVGIGLAYVRSWSVVAELAEGSLVRVLADWTPSHPGFRLYYPGHRHVPAGLRALAGVLRTLE